VHPHTQCSVVFQYRHVVICDTYLCFVCYSNGSQPHNSGRNGGQQSLPPSGSNNNYSSGRDTQQSAYGNGVPGKYSEGMYGAGKGREIVERIMTY